MNKTYDKMTETRDVFISHHASSAIDTVKKLVAALEGAGVSCWYAPRDCEGDFAESIVRAIRGCRIFLFVLNHNSGVSEHCKNEVSQAFSRYSVHDNIAFLPFRIEDCGLSDGLSYYMNRFHIMDGGTPPEQLKLTELIGRVKKILSMEDFREAEVEMAIAPGEMERRQYRLLSAMQYPDTGFVGREREISEISEQMSQTDNQVILVGMGGMGKSEIAKMYIKRCAQDFDVVRWIPFEESLTKTLASDTALPIEGITHDDWKTDSDEEYAARKLHILESIADRRVLLIIDNFDVQDDEMLTQLCEGRFAIIFTTRYHQPGSGIREIEILPMTDEEELMGLFRAEYKRALSREEESCVREIISFLEGHTLSIRLVASAMETRRIKPDRMLEMLRENSPELKENAKLADLIYGRLKSVFRLTALSEEERFVMKNLSLIPMSGIEVETFSDWCGADFDDIDALIEKSWIVHDPVLDKIHLHPLVTDLMLEELAEDPDCCVQMLEKMLEAFLDTYRRSYEEKQRKVDYLETVCSRLPKNHPLYSKMLLCKADALQNHVGFKAAIRIYRQIWDGGSKSLEPAVVCGKLAHAQLLSGDAAGCRETALAGWEMYKDIPIDDMSREQGYWVMQILRRLMEAAREFGDYDEAVEKGTRALELAELMSGGQKENTYAWGLLHLARVLYMRNTGDDLQKSEAMMRESEALFKADGDDWSRAFSNGFLGLVLAEKGKYEEALSQLKIYYDLLLPKLGPEHYDIGQYYVWCGDVYQKAGDKEKAGASYRRAAELFRIRGADARRAAAEAKLAEL